MSSSAALCLAIVLCIHGPDLDKQDACVEAQRLEHVVLGTPCGLLDQMAMMYSEENYCTLINFSSFETEHIPYPSEWRFKLIDSGIHRTLNSKDYRQTASEETKQFHVASENKRVQQSLSVPTVEFGKLLNETHASLSRIGVSTPEIDAQVEGGQHRSLQIY